MQSLLFNTFLNVYFDVMYFLDIPPWSIGEAQPDLVGLEAEGGIPGKLVLDVGCGDGENAIHLAQRGYQVIAIDTVAAAVQMAQKKARLAGVEIDFRVFDALQLAALEKKFDVVIDYGLLHQFRGSTVEQYIYSLATTLKPGGKLILQCFSDQGKWLFEFGPRKLSQRELHNLFAKGWHIDWIRPAKYHTTAGLYPAWVVYPAWLASITRL